LRPRWLIVLGSVCIWSSGCTAFPSIPNGACGNAVIDATEDCDTFAPSGLRCRPKGDDDECRLDCSPLGSGLPALCPSGWGCDAAFVCRRPSADFDAVSAPVDVGAWSLSAADFDGDGRSDVMSKEPLDAIGETRLRFYYFDQRAELAETHFFPKLLISPAIADVSGDGRPDVSFVNGALGVLRGRADRTWVPETFSSYRVEGSNVRVVPVYDVDIARSFPVLPLIDYPGQLGKFPAGASLFVIDPESSTLRARVRVADSIAALAGEPVSGNLFENATESPCAEPVLAARGATHFVVVDTCFTDEAGVVDWRPEFAVREVALVPPAPIDGAPLIADLDADGHLDVLLGAGGRAYVAYGDGSALAAAVPYVLPHREDDGVSSELPMPLAVGDLTGDGAPDFVFPDHLLLSIPSGSGSLPRYSESAQNRLGSAWTSAKFADFNGNGQVDLAVASNGALNVEFYNGTGTPSFTVNVISTSAPVQALVASDLDGDSIDDLVISELPRPGQSLGSLAIAFGAAFAVPNPPVTVAQLHDLEAVAAYRNGGIGDLLLASNEEVDGKSGGALTFLQGSGDRVPFASLALTEFASNGNVGDSAAFAVAAGKFSSKNSDGDLLALAVRPVLPRSAERAPAAPWLVPEVAAPGVSTTRFADGLDARLSPLDLSALDTVQRADVASTAADLNGDGRDEAVFAMPAGAGRSECALLVFHGVARSPRVSAQEPILIGKSCLDPELAAVDADSDGAIDLVLLTGELGSDTRQLLVFWNDGSGAFASGQSSRVSGEADSPQGFSFLPGTPANERATDPASAVGRPPGFAYVTRAQALFAGASADPRVFNAPTVLAADLHGGSGIVAADVNGDLVSDLVIAESGMLRVLRARLEGQ